MGWELGPQGAKERNRELHLHKKRAKGERKGLGGRRRFIRLIFSQSFVGVEVSPLHLRFFCASLFARRWEERKVGETD